MGNTNQLDYTVDDPVIVNFQNSFPSELDWIGVYPCNDPNAVEVDWDYTNGVSSGSISFQFSIGCYVAYYFDSNIDWEYNTPGNSPSSVSFDSLVAGCYWAAL